MVFLSPAWWVKSSGGTQSLPTCNTLWNGKSIHLSVVDGSFSESPAWIAINHSGHGGSPLNTTSTTPHAFCRQISPGFIHRAMLRINSNSLTGDDGGGFKVYLGLDGPVAAGDIGDGTPIKKQLIFNVLDRFDPGYNQLVKFPTGAGGVDDTVLPLFSGHSYGYIIETTNDEVLTGTIKFSILTSIYYGGAGA